MDTFCAVRVLFKVPFSEFTQDRTSPSWVLFKVPFSKYIQRTFLGFILKKVLKNTRDRVISDKGFTRKKYSLKKNFIARTNLFGNFAKSLRPVILKSTESSHGLVNFQKQSPGENVFFQISKNLLGKTCGEVFF